MNTAPELSDNLQFLLQAVRWRVESRANLTAPLCNQNLGIEDYSCETNEAKITELVEFSFEDEEGILKLAGYHNLLPWLWFYLDEYSVGSEQMRQKLAEMMRFESLKNQSLTKETLELSRELSKKKVKHLILKGLSVQALFYRGFVTQRYCDDIDLLIAPQDLRSSYSAFTARGYVLREDQDIEKLADFLEHNSGWYRWRDIGWQKTKKGRERLDLHWRIADSFTLPIATNDLLNASANVTINDQYIPCLSFNTLFVYVCVHGQADHFFRLRYLVDIYCAMQQPSFDLEKVNSLAEEWGVLENVEQSIGLVNRFFIRKTSDNDSYSDFVIKRYNKSNSFPERGHAGKNSWRASDRIEYLLKQIRRRSRKRSWLSPIIARCKYNQTMLEHWPRGGSALFWYPIALFNRLLK